MNVKQIKNEIIKCGKSPSYFIRNYVKIRHPVRGIIPFSLFEYQEKLLSDYENHRFNVVLKARQLGVSELTAAYITWLLLFRRNKSVLIVATKADTAKNMIKKVKTAIKKVPKWLMLAEVTTDNVMSVEFSHGSWVKAVASSKDAGRSEALSLLVVDEAAFIKGMDEIWTGLLPTTQAGGSAIVLSTPNGVGNVFHKLYSEADSKISEFFSTKLMWWEHPERCANLEDDPDRPGFKTSDWFRHETKNMSRREIAQELECDFLASGDTVISADTMEWIYNNVCDPISMEGFDRNIYVWDQPIKDRKYLLSVDVARGDGKDNSAIIVWDPELMEQCAEYYGKIPVDDLADIACYLGDKYNTALMAVENNNAGLACIEHIKLKEYENMYYTNKDKNKPGEAVSTLYGPANEDLIPGVTTSPRTRPLMISKMEEYTRNKSIWIKSKRLLEELRTFIWHNGRPEAMRGYNDDLVMSMCIGVWIRDTFLSTSYVSIDVQKKMLENVSKNVITNDQIVGASKDPRFVPRGQLAPLQEDQPLKMGLPDGSKMDLSWLIRDNDRKINDEDEKDKNKKTFILPIFKG